MPSRKNALSNFDIMDIIHSQGVDDFQGVFMKYQLPDKLERGSYVINLASSTDRNGGTHWVCLYYTPNFSNYYDSYGFIAPLEVQKKITPYMYNDLEIQDKDSTACGFYCVAFMLYLNNK
jgi:hypothetical protein